MGIQKNPRTTNISRKKGGEVYVATRKKEAQEKAKELGAFKVSENIKDFKDENLEVIVDFAGAGVTTADALSAIAPGGTVVVVGMGKLESTINTGDLIMKAATIRGSVGGTREDIEEVIKLISEDRFHIETEKVSFEEVPEGLERLHEGKVTKRLVMVND